MSLLLILYIGVFISLVYVLYFLNQRSNRYMYQKYLTFGMLILFLWMSVYTSLFLFKFDSILDLYRVRLSYALGSSAFYALLVFFFYYGVQFSKYKAFFGSLHKWLFILFVTFILSVVCTDQFIESVQYNEVNGESYETFGPLYNIVALGNLLNIVLLIILFIYKRYTLSGLYKLRFSYIASGYGIMIFCVILFLAILPLFDIWIVQREQIVFFFPFLLGLLYSTYRYKFGNISLGVGRIFIFLFSGLLSIFLVFALKNIFTLLDHSFLTFWSLTTNVSLGDIIVGNVLFYIIHGYMQSQFKVHYDSSFSLQKELTGMQTQIPFLQDSNKLNNFLKSQFFQKIGIGDAKIISGNELSKIDEIVQYFQNDSANDFFLNDIVFIEENRHKFSQDKIMRQVDKTTMLYIPMYKKKEEVLGILCVGRKPFGDYYRLTEINLLQDFASFLTGHLTYMNIYSKINELNLTLDKKVDEKTIEYNNLINRQKEFIAYVGHEIRNPITNTIFLCYDLQEKIGDQVGRDKIGGELKEDMDVLSGELKKVSDLSKEIFTTEKIDLGKTKLYKNSVNLREFLMSEISVLEINNPDVVFNQNIRDIGRVDIDEIQFRQVIQNLLGNALKFIPKRRGKISIDMKPIDNNNIFITIEDNGKGFSDVSNTNVFDKYRTGNHESSGLGMGLYLCKKIVELHGGTIESSKSHHLGGVQFTIIL